jgi:hypothetical protein
MDFSPNPSYQLNRYRRRFGNVINGSGVRHFESFTLNQHGWPSLFPRRKQDQSTIYRRQIEIGWHCLSGEIFGTLDIDLEGSGKNGNAISWAHTPTRHCIDRRRDKPLLVIDTKWKRLKGSIDDPKRGVGHADIYQMMAYAHVYECDRLMLLYPHHHELAAMEGLVAVHQIANKSDT